MFFAFFPYGGNGGISSEHPSIRRWFARTILKAKADPRVGEMFDRDYADTPITMTRNRAVVDAKKAGADLLLMIDSDQHPDYELDRGDAGAKPFWDSTFGFVYDHHAKGPVCVAAPYCGPPPHENCYVFRWANRQSEHPNADLRLDQYSREDAALRGGFENVAALPTGLILVDLRCFDFLEKPWFYYEYTDDTESEKASTEDVTMTRDLCIFGQHFLGYNPVFVNWDSWAGHWKPKCVGKPRPLTSSEVSDRYANAIKRGVGAHDRLVDVGAGKNGFIPRIVRAES